MVDLAELETAELEALQNLEPASIARTTTLGTALDFTPAIPAASRLVSFFRQIPKDRLAELPDAQRQQVITYASACWKTIQSMLEFDPAMSNAPNERQGLISQLSAQYGETFGVLAAT